MQADQHESSIAPIHDGAAFRLPTWDSVGGSEAMRRVVDILVDRAVGDSRINYDRGGKYPQTEETIARTKALALAFLSNALEGPLSYRGRPLGDVHQPMAIRPSELDAFLGHFNDAMRECGLAPSIISDLSAAVAAVRPAILAR
jgi:hemoglobin